jgi:hypothetical protein
MMALVTMLVLVAAAAVGVAAGLRRLGLQSEGIVAGLLVGVLAGPAMLGRVAPTPWAHAVLGADDARAAVEQAVSERQAYRMAATTAGIPAETIDVELANRDQAIDVLRGDANRAMATHARPWMIATTALAVLAFWLGWAAFRPVRREPIDIGVPAMVSVSCWAALLPAFTTIVVFRLLGRSPTDPEVLTAAACLAVAGWPAAAADARLLARLRVHDLAAASAAFATILAAMIAIGARLAGGTGWGLVALPLAVFQFGPKPRTIRQRTRCRLLLTNIVLPIVTAFAVLRSEFLIETPWIATIALLLVAGDGRGFGWLIGLRLGGVGGGQPGTTEEPATRPSVGWSTALIASGAAGAQLVFAAIALALGEVSSGLGFGLVLGAAAIDLFGPMRRRMARMP